MQILRIPIQTKKRLFNATHKNDKIDFLQIFAPIESSFKIRHQFQIKNIIIIVNQFDESAFQTSVHKLTSFPSVWNSFFVIWNLKILIALTNKKQCKKHVKAYTFRLQSAYIPPIIRVKYS